MAGTDPHVPVMTLEIGAGRGQQIRETRGRLPSTRYQVNGATDLKTNNDWSSTLKSQYRFKLVAHVRVPRFGNNHPGPLITMYQ